MRSIFRSALFQLALFLLAGWLVGVQVGAIERSLLLALLLYLIVFLFGYYRFLHWLATGDESYKPFASSPWAGLTEKTRRRIAEIEVDKVAIEGDKAFFLDLLNALEYSIVVIDVEDRIAWANLEAKSTMKIGERDDIGRNLLNLYRSPALHKYISLASYAMPLVIDSPYEATLKLEIQVRQFNSFRVLVARDVSEDIKLQTMREDFTANVSHELKTPLTVIAGYLELLKENRQELPAMWIDAVGAMQEQSQRMEDLVRDLIMLSRLETLQPAAGKSTIDVVSLLRKAIDEARVTASDKKITLTVEGEQLAGQRLNLEGSETELRSAFNNIIQNAIRYTGPSGEIAIRCYIYYQTFRVSVTDNGAGIAQEHIHRLTERFYRVDESRTAATGGTGLGLAIVKHVLSRHKGILEVASAEGSGSTFTCVFPLAKLQLTPA